MIFQDIRIKTFGDSLQRFVVIPIANKRHTNRIKLVILKQYFYTTLVLVLPIGIGFAGLVRYFDFVLDGGVKRRGPGPRGSGSSLHIQPTGGG